MLRMLRLNLLLPALCLLSSVSVAESILALRPESVFSRVGLHPLSEHPPALGEGGISYLFVQRIGDAKLQSITVAVHPTVELARAFLRDVSRFSIGFRPEHCTFALGDEAYLYGDTSGTLRFRRDNVTLQISWSGPIADLVSKLNQLDDLIRNDTTVAVRGTFGEPPMIEALDVARALDSEPVQVTTRTRGLGDTSQLSIEMRAERGEGAVTYLSKNRWALSAKKYDHIPPVPVTIQRPDGTRVTELKSITVSPRGRAIIRVMVANADHVFVTRDFEVPVAE